MDYLNTTNATTISTPSSSNNTTTTTTSLSALNSTMAVAVTTTGATSATSLNLNTNSNSSSSNGSSDKKQKKTVTFKNVLETSDDKSAVKKFYNPDNRKPLVSIIKKECLNRPLMYTRNSECIVRPSRLTEILKNNSNIDKLNSLKFRSNHTNVSSASATTTEGCSVLAGPLSRVFGAPSEEEDNKQKHSIINFRLSKEQSDDDEDDDDNEEENGEHDDEDEDEEEGEEEEEEEDDVGIEEEDEQQHLEEANAVKFRNDMSKQELEQKNKLKLKMPNEDDDEEEQQMIVDKHFVLPKRSSRSSRVIKPNSRLIEDGVICKKSVIKPSSNTTSSTAALVTKEEKLTVVNQQPNYFGLGDYNAKDCNGSTSLKSSKDLLLENSKLSAVFASSSCSSSNPTNVFSNFATTSNSSSSTSSSTAVSGSTSLKPSSFVLRQPRLQFESLSNVTSSTATATSDRSNNSSNVSVAAAAAALALSASLPKSLQQAISSSAASAAGLSSSAALLSPTFSLNGTSAMKNNNNTISATSSSPPAYQCAVCSSIIHSKNLPQANKYVEPSCEHCRKFISKIAKKSLAMKNSPTMKTIQLQCKADGDCVILPLNNKAGHLKNFKKVYKERCGYCWLKKCLQTLQLPKVRLNALLPVLNNVSLSCGSGTSKSSLQDSKSKKELLEETAKPMGTIKWKSLIDPLITTANSGSTSLNETLKLSLKSNPLVENNVTFGSVPLLRPAILEKPLFLKTSLETKQEKVDKKPLDVLKDVKTEKPDTGGQDTATLTQAVKSASKKKDKSGEKERKEVRMKEMLSPKMENEKTKEIKEKVENMMVDLKETKNEENLSSTTVTSTATVSVSSPNQPITTTNTTATTQVATSNVATATTADKRQRIDLKGPRVKHVCRSASIVLGQPLAMFGEEGEEAVISVEQLQQTLEQTETKVPLTDENDNCASCKTQQLPSEDTSGTSEPPLKTAKIEKIESTSKALVPVTKLSQRPHHYNTQLTVYKKQINSQMNPAMMPPRARKEPQLKCKLLISIDFWENYDPAEVCQTGFGLIVTETVAQRALCFLCGSAGQEPLIFCSCCCEPYHQYCVQDEFNLKHGSLDETLLLNESCLSVTGLSTNANTAIAKLNWLCPRCTVCYTCNMSSGAKVKCQKCQKNYHSTCLGTSKRLLGADRPLICVNCLKCRSCSTTKVTKFVGNLPMCTNCFKLRKKGNYCPVCQKCYDDQDFDLKMMECGDCHQWVHAKCETLTDEQYNLLSTLPESIEFICKRCSRKSQDAKQRACEWREAVKEEFKSSLMSVLKLLSKSRQACALLKLSPRKQMKCSCGSLSSSSSTTGSTSNNKFHPKSLQFSSQQQMNGNTEQDQLAPTNNIDIYEFDDRERDQLTLNPASMDMQTKKCLCQQQLNANQSHLSLVEIKHKISNGSYVSLAEFNYDMNLVIQQANCDDLVIVYKEILSEQFPWFQNETQACTDALEEDMYESAGGAYGLNTSIDSESDYNMDCLPSAQEQQNDHDRSALLAELPQDLEDQLYNIKSRTDARICLFCRRTGEGLPGEESRLLYCGHDCWVHTNCALWSAEVFEEIDGSLQNVHSAVARGRMIKCSVCGNRGATVGCNVKSCGEHYHYPCARSKNCAFLADKSMYCPQHANSLSNSKISFETQFEVTRPVYVELERKRKKLVEPSKVQFHIGSLEVKQLGHILPRFSDTYECLVPVNFLCSRLYWSSKEPWKIVEYTVRTYIYNAASSTLTNGAIDLGKNFTVDHSQNNAALVQLGLSQIQQWHMSLAKGDYETAEEYDYLNNFPQHSSCSANNTQESNANNEEEPQTNADLLPPEIKDAIFEDLPGDLLDGISMLDIFTKCMNYEDMAQGEHSKDGVTNQQMSDEDTMTSIGAFTKQLTAELNSNWSAGSNHNHVEDALLSTTTVTAAQAVKLQKLKKSSSPVINCEVNAKNAIKRRKISENMLISLNNHQRSQKKEVTSVTRRLDMEGAKKGTFTWSAEKRYNLDNNQADGKIKLMQVDGVDDSITEYRFVTQEATQTAVKCERCQCTYRNIESFQRHLNNCEPMSSSTSESESEHNSQTPEITHTQPQALTLEQLQELNNKLQQQQQQQQQQQRTTQMPFIQSIPTQTLSQLQGLQTANILQGVQLQGVQNLQNLQNLHNIQQLTQPQTLGGNFFISTAQPEMQQATSDLQLYANTLQGLTANLNGTFTLQPTTTQFPNASQIQQNQPQLIAVSTNPDGTQQIIQLPSTNTQPHQTAPTATYQTLQATNSDKKIVLPVTQGKPLKTMATKAAQQAAAKNKLKATTVVKPIQSKINNTTATTTTHITQPQTVNATQLLNQQLLQQLQQQAQQNSTQPQLLFQTAQPQQQQPQIIMQQPQNIISFVTTTNDGTQQPQLQYVTLPTAQQATEFKPQAQASLFTTANTQPLLQSAYLQTDATGNLVLTNAPPQTAAPLQLLTTPQGPQVIGTLIQPQTLQLQGGNVITTTTTATAEGGIPQQGTTQAQQQQVIISGNPAAGGNGLEMLTAATTPQVILATTTQPMYYGLETIVQNTVMSSQQFVSTAMPGVLSQNASFSATTTQVFQASKIEPLVDIPAGYVLLNNVDANNALMQTQQTATTAAAAAAATTAAQQQANQNTFIQAALQQQAQALAEQQQQQQQQQVQNNVYRLQTPPVTTTTQSFLQAQAQPQIVVTQQPQVPPTAVTQAQFVEATTTNTTPNVHLVSAKVAPVAQVKRTKTAAPVAAVTKVQPQVVNKVMPNVVQQQQPQKIKLQATQMQQQPAKQVNTQTVNSLLQQQQQPIQATISVTPATQQNDVVKPQIVIPTPATITATATLNTTTVTSSVNNKKTNMIRPLHKLEVKPKIMKTAATATVVTKPSNNTNVNTVNHPPLSQLPTPPATNPNKMVVLKPQQQQTASIQQHQTSVMTNNTPNNNITTLTEETTPIMPLSNLAESTETTEFMNIQHVTNNHQQHYNVADALLLDETSQMAQQTLSHCSFSNTTNNYESAHNPQPTAASAAANASHNNTDTVSNILPTIQRMPQYTNINIVNPLQQYSTTNTNTLSTSTSTTTTTITRPTNRVLPMQQRQYEQHSQTTCSTTSSSTSSSVAAAVGATQFTHTSTTNSQISQNHQHHHNITTATTVDATQNVAIKANINKIAYEAEVKQMLLHSPQPQHESPQQNQLNTISHQQMQQQQQHVLHMQQQNIQHNLAKSSPPPLTYDLGEKHQDPGSKMCLHDMNYVNNSLTDFVNSSTPEQCLITDPKFPPEGEVILGSDCCENEEEALSSANNEEEEEEQPQEEEEDDGFSLKMPSADGSDNLSMDSDEPAVKEKISKILDNLTNEDCNDSLNTNTTLEAQAEMACNNQYLNATLRTDNGMENVNHNITVNNNNNNNNNNEQTQITPQEANQYYTPTTEETSAFIAAQLVAENMKDQQVVENFNNIMEAQASSKLQEEVENSLNSNYIQNCTPATNLNDVPQTQRTTNNLTAPLTMSANQASQPPSRDPKRITGPHLLYEIQSEDGFTYKSSSITEVWEKVFEAVQVARRANGLAPLPEGPLADMSGVQMIGLKTNALKYLIEQLPGVEKCNKYTPKYHRRNGSLTSSHTTSSSSSLSSSSSMNGNASVATSLDTDCNSMDYASDQEDLTENPYECARCEPYSKRSEYDMFSWLASRHRKQPVQVFVQPSDNELVPRRGTGSNLPMAMKYRTLKETYKDYVGVFRSHIHGRGLYCTKDIEAGEMVIEYAGELIRSTLTDQRERYYNSRGIGCYMFKIDDHLVVDATMRGNAARFINHSCEPNCYSKVVDILGHKHIIIFALRRIVQGEELTYDYKFPFEDEKIPCSCGSKRCRKYLN
ncbi:histone lysine N-methyltransferase trithorax isoform 2-T6 [Cochliomyia hominivorax]